jgi:hypothetical protein
MSFIILIFGAKIGINHNTNRFKHTTKPLLFIPLLSIISTELYLILNQHSIFILSRNKIYLILVSITVLISAYRWFTDKKYNTNHTDKEKILPYVVIVSIALIGLYSPVIYQHQEMFELANPANGIMRMFKFGELPFVNFINSHMISELFFKVLYVVFNGYNGSTDFFIYDFLYKIIYYIIVFKFFKWIFNDYKYALILILFMPFLEVIISYNSAFSIITIFLLYNFYKRTNSTTLLHIILYSVFLLFWRLDVGVANLSSVLLLVPIIIFAKNKIKILKRDVILFFSISIGVLAVLLSLNTFTEYNLNIKQMIDYFGASQAHGLSTIAYNSDRFFYNIYFIFPVVVIGIISYILHSIINNKKQNNIQIAILFLGFYYIFNFQRGLVRHSLMEGESFTNSFFYLIIILFLYSTIKNKWKAKISILFLSLLFIANFKYKDALDYENLFENFINSTNKLTYIESSNQKIDRCIIDKEFAKSNYSDFVAFMDSNFNDTSTFIDLSNTPMLYFYSQRRVPSFFNQYMQNTVTDFLQEQNINRLTKYNIPVVVFSHIPQNWWDNTDGVPNTIRYYKISQYIFKHYKPIGNINNYYIWIKKDIDKISTKQQKEPDNKPLKYDLRYYAYILGKTTDLSNTDSIKVLLNNNKIELDTIHNRINNYLLLNITNNATTYKELSIKYGETKNYNEFIFRTKHNSNTNYIIPISSQYKWVLNNYNTIEITQADSTTVNYVKYYIK